MKADERARNERRTSLERYLLMGEKEKDVEIQKAVARLQKRVQEILYMLETDQQHIARPPERNTES
jgi:hypothetical protein